MPELPKNAEPGLARHPSLSELAVVFLKLHTQALSPQLSVADWGRGSDWIDGGGTVTAPEGR
jgi:hypothetical protein